VGTALATLGSTLPASHRRQQKVKQQSVDLSDNHDLVDTQLTIGCTGSSVPRDGVDEEGRSLVIIVFSRNGSITVLSSITAWDLQAPNSHKFLHSIK
jgi:hypothetical protein